MTTTEERIVLHGEGYELTVSQIIHCVAAHYGRFGLRPFSDTPPRWDWILHIIDTHMRYDGTFNTPQSDLYMAWAEEHVHDYFGHKLSRITVNLNVLITCNKPVTN